MDVSRYLDGFTRRDWQTIEAGTVRIAVVGLGDFARTRALPSIRDATFCEATVVVSGSPGKAERVADEFDVDRIIDYEAYADGEASDAYDAVYVATPPAFHAEHTEVAARLGKHVLCEKPLARDVAEADRMLDACASNGVVLMTAYRLRVEPAVRRGREIIRDGLVGDVVRVTAGFSIRLLDHAGPDSWRLDPTIAGGGALMDVGVYPLQVSRFLLDQEPDAVWGDLESWSEPFGDVEEHAVAHLLFPSGVTAACTASFNAHPDNRVHVLGTDGQLIIQEPFGGTVSQTLVVERRDARTEYTGPAVDEVTEEFDYFANCVLAGIDCESAGADGRADLAIIEAAYESAETGRRVSL